jgi:hypothetical protein
MTSHLLTPVVLCFTQGIRPRQSSTRTSDPYRPRAWCLLQEPQAKQTSKGRTVIISRALVDWIFKTRHD